MLSQTKYYTILSGVLFLCCLSAAASNMPQGQDSIAPTGDIASHPVLFDSDTLFFIQSESTTFPAHLRAARASAELEEAKDEYNRHMDSIVVLHTGGSYTTFINDNFIFLTTPNDALLEDQSMEELANYRTDRLKQALEAKEMQSETIFKRLGYFTLSLVALLLMIALINALFRRIDKRLSKIEKTFLKKNKNFLKYFIPRQTANIFVFISKIIRIALIVVILITFSPFMFSFFPWAEHMVNVFYGYIEKPILYVVYGFIDFIPSLFFIIIIAVIARYVVRVLKAIATDVEKGKFKIPNFHKDWAKPTEKIVSIFIYAIALVLIFPYLPGSGSSAFQGVSIFIGAIISFGSTSAIANIIAGIVITYMRPFQIGDRVKIDNIVGDVIGKTILITHIRTPKNEDVTIPNANILIGNIINYSNNDEGSSTILHTTVTLGYDLPWQTAEDLLLKAAEATELVLKEPKPFVLQTSLDDYYVSYELNVHTKESKKIPLIYSEVHKHILETFNAAGVEILSPAYNAIRDGNLTTVPSQLEPNAKGPLHKIVDHLTGRNQKPTITKSSGDGL